MILFTRNQHIGFGLLILLIIMMTVLPRQFIRPAFPPSFPGDSLNAGDSSHILLKPEIRTGNPGNIRYGDTAERKPVELIDLNKADSITLVKIRGIGSYFASSIIKYRNRLGGFASPAQLKEIKLRYFNADEFIPYFTADSYFIVKKAMDTMSFKSLLRHPYLDYEDVKLIFKMKNRYLHIDMETLKHEKLFPEDKIRKLALYFR